MSATARLRSNECHSQFWKGAVVILENSLSAELHEQLLAKKAELYARLERIGANLRRPLDADSKEQAKQLEDQEVVDALGNEARTEVQKINRALGRIAAGTYGECTSCGVKIDRDRLVAYPHADSCIDCATQEELKAINA